MEYTVEVRERAPQAVASVRLSVAPADLETTVADTLLEIWAAVSAQQVPPAGPPFLRYHAVSEATLDVEMGFPVGGVFQPTGRIVPSTLPGGAIAATWHVGPYEELRAAYAALAAWLEAAGHAAVGAPWEVYWTDPVLTPDPRQWRTEVHWPLPGSAAP